MKKKRNICWKKARKELTYALLTLLGIVLGIAWMVFPDNYQAHGAFLGILSIIVGDFGFFGFFIAISTAIEFENVRRDMSYFNK